MFKNISKFFSLGVICVLVGCVTPWKPSIFDLFQVPTTTRVYLSSNLWHTDPVGMDSFNYQEGKILPFGTEVIDVDFDEELVTFKAKSTGSVYGIRLMKEYSMISMHEYLKQVFIITNPAEIELSIEATTFEKIVRGVVEVGMTKKQVEIAYGIPSRHRTPSVKSDTWIYHKSDVSTKRVVFKKGIVTAILDY